MKQIVFYLGLSLLFTHELDAMSNHEWRVLPFTSYFNDTHGEFAFVLMHIPLFAVIIGFVASLNPKIRARARAIASGFLVLHALLHLLFSGSDSYEFSSVLSSVLIYGSATCGIACFLMGYYEARPDDL